MFLKISFSVVNKSVSCSNLGIYFVGFVVYVFFRSGFFKGLSFVTG